MAGRAQHLPTSTALSHSACGLRVPLGCGLLELTWAAGAQTKYQLVLIKPVPPTQLLPLSVPRAGDSLTSFLSANQHLFPAVVHTILFISVAHHPEDPQAPGRWDSCLFSSPPAWTTENTDCRVRSLWLQTCYFPALQLSAN